jgi:moderate conductance mechanosensitive channel
MLFDDFFQNPGVQILLIILFGLFINIIGRTSIERLVRRAVRADRYESKVDERKREDTIINILRAALLIGLLIVGVFGILAVLQVNIAALATGAGLFGVIFGLGAQQTIRNMLAGIYVLTENQYRVGDVVTVSGGPIGQPGASGVVEEITLRVTKIRDMNGQLHIVSNGDAALISNKTFKFSNVLIEIMVNYDSNLDLVEKIINDLGKDMLQDEDMNNKILEPVRFLRVEDFTPSGVQVKLLGRVKPGAQWDVAGEYRRRLKEAFAGHNLEFAFPESIVHNETVRSRKQ